MRRHFLVEHVMFFSFFSERKWDSWNSWIIVTSGTITPTPLNFQGFLEHGEWFNICPTPPCLVVSFTSGSHNASPKKAPSSSSSIMSHWVQHDTWHTIDTPNVSYQHHHFQPWFFPKFNKSEQPFAMWGWKTMLFGTWRKWLVSIPKDLSSSNSLASGAPTLHVGQTAQGCEHFIGRPTICVKQNSRPMWCKF